MNKIVIRGKFEIINSKFLKFLEKYKKNNEYKVIFLFNDSKLISFESRKLLLEQHLQDLNYEIVGLEGSKFCNNGILQRVGNENELDISKRMVKVKEVFFVKKHELAQLVDAPLNYLKYYLENRYFIFDKIANMMSEERYKHTISVALTAVEIAKANKINPKKPFLAAMLHDIAKDTSIDVTKNLMLKCFKKHINEEEVVYHQFIGTIFARKLFKIYNKDILNAIKYHTTGRARMSILEKLIYVSDKIEPNRKFNTQKSLDYCIKNFEKGFIKIIKQNKRYLSKKTDIKLDKSTQECYEYYLK
jgi:nicotinate-nucleotide adenylyltransferase